MSAFAATGAGCPCGSGQPYAVCCGPLHHGAGHAVTAEQLMRSRYAAFVVGDAAYLSRTWHPRHRPVDVRLDPDTAWEGLRILRSEAGGGGDERGTVEFVARYVERGRPGRLHEVSRFERRGGRWVYVDGDPRPGG